MILRRPLSHLLILLALPLPLLLAGCSSLKAISITPASGVEILTAVGQTAQYTAIGASAMGNAPETNSNITNSVKWSVSNPNVATISSTGLATAVGAGYTQILADSDGVTALSDLTVDIVAPAPVVPASGNLTIIPTASAGATATFVGETTQFIAIGNLSGSGVIQNLTANVTWLSSDVSVATIDQTGLATAVSANTVTNNTTITAIGTMATGALITATSTLTVDPGLSGVKLPTLAVYEAGAGSGTITSTSAGVTGGIKCSPTTTACTAPFALGSLVTLTATPVTGSSFGGWSNSCIATNAPTLPQAPTCVVTMGSNETVGAIFNSP